MKRRITVGIALVLLLAVFALPSVGSAGITPMFDAPPTVRPTKSIW